MGCHRFVPVHLVPLSSAPADVFSFFSFMSFCFSFHVSSSSSFLSLTRTIVRTLVCTHTRTRTLLTTRFRWPRFVTMRFGSSVVPLHWFFFVGNHTHLRLPRPFHFHLSLLRAHVPCLLSGQEHAYLREACVCNPWNQREP